MTKALRNTWRERPAGGEQDAQHPEDAFIQQAVWQQLRAQHAPRALRLVARALAHEVLELALEAGAGRASIRSNWLALPTKLALRLGLTEHDVHVLAERLLRWSGRRRGCGCGAGGCWGSRGYRRWRARTTRARTRSPARR